MRVLVVAFLVMFTGCVHQDLKAPYELGGFYPVNDQWVDQDKEEVKDK